MLCLDYLLLSFKTDALAEIGSSWMSDLVSEEYKKHNQCQSAAEGSEQSPDSRAYIYPRLQYKVVRGSPMIAAIAEGCDLLWDIYEKLDGGVPAAAEWKVLEKRLIERKALFGISDDYIKYRFLTPWLALDEDNLKKYVAQNNGTREKTLMRILENNLKSASKSLGYEFDGNLKFRLNIKTQYIFLRDVHFAGLFGSFITNFEIPSFLGIGKSVSRGFGTIKRV